MGPTCISLVFHYFIAGALGYFLFRCLWICDFVAVVVKVKQSSHSL